MLTDADIDLARERIKSWPIAERRFLTTLTEPEARLILEGVAVLDLRPVVPVVPAPARRVHEATPKARTSDPATSHDAADAVRIKAQSAKAKLLLVHYDDHLERGPRAGLTDEEAADRADVPLRSEYATRCSELRKLEPPLLAETGEEREGAAGVSRITNAGVAYVTEHGWR